MSDEWIDICDIQDISPMGGVCALVDGKQVAIFLQNKTNQLYSISNFDPIAKASVLSRGIMGDINGRIVVSSPLLKQHFCLETGECLEDATISVKVYPVRLVKDRVQIKSV